jgi:hypothetical protein
LLGSACLIAFFLAINTLRSVNTFNRLLKIADVETLQLQMEKKPGHFSKASNRIAGNQAKI